MAKISETTTKSMFRHFYGANLFLEKSAIPNKYGFVPKRGTKALGYPDFFKDTEEIAFIVECRSLNHKQAEEKVKWYYE